MHNNIKVLEEILRKLYKNSFGLDVCKYFVLVYKVISVRVE